jgi:hypothetical protein
MVKLSILDGGNDDEELDDNEMEIDQLINDITDK